MATKKNPSKVSSSPETVTAAAKRPKRSYLKQSDVPTLSLSEALRLPQSLYDDFAGKSAAPHQLAMAVDISPTSSAWVDLSGAAIAYGLTDGGAQAAQISLTDVVALRGRRHDPLAEPSLQKLSRR